MGHDLVPLKGNVDQGVYLAVISSGLREAPSHPPPYPPQPPAVHSNPEKHATSTSARKVKTCRRCASSP